MASPSRQSMSSANPIVDSEVSSPHSPHSSRRGSAYPTRTQSLATLAREIAQDPNFSQSLHTASPTVSTGRFLVETENEEPRLERDDFASETSVQSGQSKTSETIDTEDVFRKVYTVYNTYDTCESRDRFERIAFCPPFPAGVVRFTIKEEEDTKDRYYMIVNKEASLDDVARFMATAWRRRTPKLVLSVVGSSRYFMPWDNVRFEEDFQEGIIQAANSTEMWILTEGLDFGVSKTIGDAAHREMTRRKNLAMNPLRIQNIHMTERLPHLNIFGIAPKSSLAYAESLTGRKIEGQIVENTGGDPGLNLYDLNRDHTHFILLDDEQIPESEVEALYKSFRHNLEMRFTRPVGKPRRYRHFVDMSRDTDLYRDMGNMMTPVVGLLIQGGPPDIDHIFWLLTKKIPVVVIQGSGLAADLISFAYREMQQRTDPEYLDSYIKAELMRRVSEAFPDEFTNDDIARNSCRDQIIECVKLDHQDNLSFLSIINCGTHGVRLTDLSKYLLTALFKSQEQLLGRHCQEQLQWDLQLTVDWNRPDLARSEIFDKYNLSNFKVAEHIVHMALLRPNREEFIEMFLEHGLLIHTYLNHKRLHNLFENPADKDFFVTVCLQGVIGKSVNSNTPLCHNFVDDTNCELNRLLYKCTGLKKLVNPYELSMNSLGSYVTDKDVAERRATNMLVLWAALTSRYKLAKVLWKHTEDPMAVALIVSMILHRLGTDWCKKDLDMRGRVKRAAAEFGQMAVTMLRLSYKESSMYTFTALSKQLEDFNNRNVVELAKLGENKYFIAHTCCQKWLTQRWYGNIHIRELDWGGQFKLPDWLKIYLSVFFVFPMFMWISYQTSEVKAISDEDEDEGHDDAQEISMLLHMTSIEDKMRKSKKRDRVRVTFQNIWRKGDDVKLPVWKQIHYLWSAPVTKFWLSQLLYFLYLMLMSVALLLPGCGDMAVNVSVLVWTTTIWMELIRRTIIKKRLYPEVPLMWPITEIICISLFILVMLVLRILPHFVDYVSFMTTKFLLSIFLLFFYFRFMLVSVPVSPTLGPMLVSIVTMTKKDFSDWMRLFFMVLVSGAITIQAVIYPSFPLGEESLRQAFSRAIFGLFLTKIDDLDGRECSAHFDDDEFRFCTGPKYRNSTIQAELARCPHGSLLNYVIVIPYLLNAKLIFITLLYAMFAVTTAKVYNESVEIWRYQRYVMIVDFEERLILPAPFTLLCYIFYILKWIGHLIYRAVAMVFSRSHICCMGSDLKDHASKIQIVKFRRTSDYNFWKECINHYIDEEQAEKLEQERAKNQSDCLMELLEEMKQQQMLMRHLNDRIVQLETNLTNSYVLQEEMKHMIHRLASMQSGVRMQHPATQVLHQEPQKFLHIAARQSPYKDTLIRRFPVFDKYVPWEVTYDMYDPGIYTAPMSSFPEDIQPCMDPDALELVEEQNRRQRLSAQELEELPPMAEFKPLYNTVHCVVINGTNVEIDRTSWISVDNQPLRYKLDSMNLPLNPIGRTGLRGRGKLWRFGPNHRIAAVVTRWRRRYSPLGFPLDHLLVDGKKVLECLVVSRPETGAMTLPGGDVYGKTTAYSVLCEEFLKSIFLEQEVEGSSKLDQDDMISYFAQFARLTQQYQEPKIDMAASGFSAAILYRGYIDDPTNTDNAWREAEVWNFHYDLQDMFDIKIKEREKMWQEVMPHMHLHGNQDSIVMEAARIHNAYR